jgi:[acyl-carrier-protein] S-malonyltransferase
MGHQLAETFAAARDVFVRADEALGFPLSRIAWEGPEDELTQTQNAQPAILVHSYAVWAVLGEELMPRVRFTAGHSLGEFTAYAAAGSIEFEDAVRLVRRRGELMAVTPAGSMSAVVGLEPAVVEEICTSASSDDGVVVAANYNSPVQIVISGDIDAVRRAGVAAEEAGAKMVRPLVVSGAFHSPLMTDAHGGAGDRKRSSSSHAGEAVDFTGPLDREHAAAGDRGNSPVRRAGPWQGSHGPVAPDRPRA